MAQTPKILDNLYQNIKYVGQNFFPTILPATIGLATASITLRGEPYIPDLIGSFSSSKPTTTSTVKPVSSAFKSIGDFFSKIPVIKQAPKVSFAEKFSAHAITDVSYPAISTAFSMVFNKEQFSLMEQTYKNAVFVGIITSKALSIYSCLTNNVRGYDKSDMLFKHIAEYKKTIMFTKHITELAKTILDLEVVVPSMHSVRDIINSKMPIQDKFTEAGVEEVKALVVPLGVDAFIDYTLTLAGLNGNI